VEIRCDGKEIGVFRLNAGQSSRIERPVQDDGFLTFYRLGTEEARKAVVLKQDETGKVLIRFVPEKVKRVYAVDDADLSSATLYSGERAKGGTGLSGHSEQEFCAVEAIERDEDVAQEIEFLLVAEDVEPRPLPESAAERPSDADLSLWDRGIKRVPFAIGWLAMIGIGGTMVSGGAEPGALLLPVAGIMLLQAMRLRDMRRSRAWTWLTLLPVVGLLVLVPCLIAPSKGGLVARKKP
jgi:hypothetical protein